MGTGQPPSPDLAGLTFRIERVETDVRHLSDQLSSYVRSAENDLHIQRIQDTVKRIEVDVTKAKDQLTNLNEKLAAQELAAQVREAAAREAQDKLQIRVLIWVISIVVTVLVAVLVFYLTHLIH